LIEQLVVEVAENLAHTLHSLSFVWQH
jgi:hypothetical protein